MIEIKDVYFKYDRSDILKNIDISISEGEQILLIGENGCGKSTLLSLIAGLYFPYKGEIKIDGLAYKNNEKEIKKLIGIMFQEPLGFKNSKVIEILDFFKTLNNNDMPTNDVITLTNISNLTEKKIGSLSGGEKQKVSLAISLLGNPKYLLLDEPMSALDITNRKEFISILKKLKDKGKTIITISHSFEDLSETFNKVILLKNFQIKYFGEIESLLSDLKYEYTVKISNQMINFDKMKKYKNRCDKEGNFFVYCQNEPELEEVCKKVGKVGLKVDKTTLNDIFYLID